MAEIVWEGGVFLKMRELVVVKLIRAVLLIVFSYIAQIWKLLL